MGTLTTLPTGNPVTLDPNLPDPTSLDSAIANVLASSTAQCAQLNDNLKTIYLTAFNNWAISVNAGRIDNTTPPTPPMAFVVALSPDNSGFSFPTVGTAPVCAMPPIPASMLTPVVPNVIDIGAALGGKWYACGPKDTFAVGLTTPPQADGHTYEKYAAPVGKGWYMQVS